MKRTALIMTILFPISIWIYILGGLALLIKLYYQLNKFTIEKFMEGWKDGNDTGKVH